LKNHEPESVEDVNKA